MHSYHRPRRIRYALGFCSIAFGGLVRAQGTPPLVPQCPVQLYLVDNLGTRPCGILGRVMSTCIGQDVGTDRFELGPVTVETSERYPGPTAETTVLERCQCTEVAYNLYSACAACQVGDDDTHWLTRETWFTGCKTKPPPIGAPEMALDTLPSWIKEQYDPTFSVVSARSVATGGLPIASATEFISPNATISVDGSGGSSGNPNGFASSSGTSMPIIIGAAVGGFVLLALIALAIFFCLRRRQRQRTAPSAEFMKYSQVNTTGAREPLRAHSRANTMDDDGNTVLMNTNHMQGAAAPGQGLGHGGQGYTQHNALRLDSPGSRESYTDMETADNSTSPPPFTPGLFKDPIFEKGVALNLAAAAATSGQGGGGGVSGLYGGSPVTYSPATPSTAHGHAHVGTQYGERHGLIHGRQETG